MAAFLIPLAAGLLSAGGAWYQAKQQKKIMREQMAFQERMSSTAAQRSVLDYREAGLNPALAYERTASSPPGASAMIEDAMGKGVSSAREAAALRQQMELAREQTQSNIQLQRNQAEQAQSQAHLNRSSQLLNAQEMRFRAIQQPHDLRRAAAEGLLSEFLRDRARLENVGIKNQADWERLVGSSNAAVRTLNELLRMFKR